MGMFDTIHTEHGCGQVKCFGSALAELRVGDRVVLHVELPDDEIAGAFEAEVLWGRASDEQSYDVRMAHGGGFVHVRGGVINGWDEESTPGVPCYDSHGRRVPVIGTAGTAGGVRVRMTREVCERCAGSTTGHVRSWCENDDTL